MTNCSTVAINNITFREENSLYKSYCGRLTSERWPGGHQLHSEWYFLDFEIFPKYRFSMPTGQIPPTWADLGLCKAFSQVHNQRWDFQKMNQHGQISVLTAAELIWTHRSRVICIFSAKKIQIVSGQSWDKLFPGGNKQYYFPRRKQSLQVILW